MFMISLHPISESERVLVVTALPMPSVVDIRMQQAGDLHAAGEQASAARRFVTQVVVGYNTAP